MSDDNRRREIQNGKQIGDGSRHACKRLRARAARRGKAVAGQIGRDDAKAPGEKRREIAPRMRCGPNAMQQQKSWTGSHDLDVPGEAPRLNHPARLPVWPIRAVRVEIKPTHRSEECVRVHAVTIAARTACERPEASA
jgi:hypothetical protein